MSAPAILALNSGSSSLKVGLFELDADEVRPLARGSADGIASQLGKISVHSADGKSLYEQQQPIDNQSHALQLVAAQLRAHNFLAPSAVGHRVVHGGPSLVEHQKITPEVLRQLEAAAHFAPLHVPIALTLIHESQRLFPGIPQFACFDTAFHRTLPEVAARLPLPQKFWEAGMRRYGFHGLSCESILHTLGETVPPCLIIAHLGNGASITAVSNGVSVDNSMGLTPTGGIIMGTRPGDLDPGVLLHILATSNNDVAALAKLLDQESGLLGISGMSRDVRQLHGAASQNSRARLALEMFARAAKKTIAAYIAILGGLDLLVFTGGIGEHDPATRTEICKGLDSFGPQIDLEANQRNARDIASPQSRARVSVLPTDEESQIARHVARLSK
jgi:acetate kinase